VDSAEIDSLVGELESRVDRLRALYDQYFMGIERLEPLVPKKDVERRLTVLRKEQIRNTGTRYRFQMIVQRYNTFTTYWQRISRQIEQGTYKRDVMRAQARFGVDPKRERLAAPPEPEPNRDRASAHAIAVPEQPIEEVYELEAVPDGAGSLEDDLLADIQRQPPRAAPAERFVSAAKLELDEFSDPFEELDPFPKPRPSAPRSPVVTRMNPSEPRDTDRRIPVAAPATPSRAPVVAPPPARPLRPETRVVVAKRGSIPDPLEAAPVPPPPPSVRNVSPAMASAPRVQLRGAAPAAPPQPSQGVRAAPAPAATANAAPPRPAPIAAPPQPRPAPAPAPARPAPAPAPARPAPPPPAPAPPPRIGDLTRDRFGQIYSQYVETRRRQNEPTGAITRDALAKQLDESTSRLKQKHGAKAIDFEVVVKDGRTILRPVVK
jgi:hypothetical protein